MSRSVTAIVVLIPGVCKDFHSPRMDQVRCVCVGTTELCTSSRAAGLLGSEKSGALVWSVRRMYLTLGSAADSTKGLAVWKLAIFSKEV